MSGDDLYAVLGVPVDASRAQIVQAYRRRAHAAHPDTHPADPTAAARFRDLTDAYNVLRDPARRSTYDRDRAIPPPVSPSPSWSSVPVPVPPVSPFPPVGPPLWAGPVHVEPPTTTRAAPARPATSPGSWAWLLARWLEDGQ